MNSSEPCVNILLGRLDKMDGKNADAEEKFQIAYDKFEQKWINNSLNKADYGWFSSVAEELGKKDMAYEIFNAKPKIGHTSHYDVNNLSRTIVKSLTKK